MDPSPENNRAACYQGPMKLEVVKELRRIWEKHVSKEAQDVMGKIRD